MRTWKASRVRRTSNGYVKITAVFPLHADEIKSRCDQATLSGRSLTNGKRLLVITCEGACQEVPPRRLVRFVGNQDLDVEVVG